MLVFIILFLNLVHDDFIDFLFYMKFMGDMSNKLAQMVSSKKFWMGGKSC